jgi:hypothetical protein
MIPEDYEMRDDDVPAEMTGNIDYNARRLIEENEKKYAAKPVKKAVKNTRIEPIIPEDRPSDEEIENRKSYLGSGAGVDSRVNDAISAAKRSNKGKYKPIKMNSGGSVSSASKRADGIAQRGKTKGRMC